MIAKNASDEEAEAAFRVDMNGMTPEMVKENNDVAVWLVEGYEPGPLALGVVLSAEAGARPYPASSQMGLMHTALGNGVADFLTGAKDAQTTLKDIAGAYTTSAKEAGLIK